MAKLGTLCVLRRSVVFVTSRRELHSVERVLSR